MFYEIMGIATSATLVMFAFLVWAIYEKMDQPVVFARLDPGPQLYVENAGKGTAWGGVIQCTARPSGGKFAAPITFIRLPPGIKYTFPSSSDPRGPHLIIQSSDKELKVEIAYKDYDPNQANRPTYYHELKKLFGMGPDYKWEHTFSI